MQCLRKSNLISSPTLNPILTNSEFVHVTLMISMKVVPATGETKFEAKRYTVFIP